MNCFRCGAPMANGAAFCPKCGADMRGAVNMNRVNMQPRKNASGALIALIIVGVVILMISIAVILVLVLGRSGAEQNETSMVQPASAPYTEAAAEPVQPAEPVYAAPVFSRITASSTRPVDYTSGVAVYYPPEYAIDGNYDTCWSPDRSVSLTPTLTLSSDTPQHVRGIRLSNGYFKTSETYTRNRRITRAEILYNGGKKTVDLSINSYRVMQDIVFDAPADTTYIEIHVLDTYYGDWKDICISEVEVY